MEVGLDPKELEETGAAGFPKGLEGAGAEVVVFSFTTAFLAAFVTVPTAFPATFVTVPTAFPAAFLTVPMVFAAAFFILLKKEGAGC